MKFCNFFFTFPKIFSSFEPISIDPKLEGTRAIASFLDSFDRCCSVSGMDTHVKIHTINIYYDKCKYFDYELKLLS